jgi:hypothetical protein
MANFGLSKASKRNFGTGFSSDPSFGGGEGCCKLEYTYDGVFDVQFFTREGKLLRPWGPRGTGSPLPPNTVPVGTFKIKWNFFGKTDIISSCCPLSFGGLERFTGMGGSYCGTTNLGMHWCQAPRNVKVSVDTLTLTGNLMGFTEKPMGGCNKLGPRSKVSSPYFGPFLSWCCDIKGPPTNITESGEVITGEGEVNWSQEICNALGAKYGPTNSPLPPIPCCT